METKVNTTLVGAFVLGLGALLLAALLWLASGGATPQKHDLYSAVSDESVAGLNVNAPVKYAGVDVGRVRSIRLDPADPDRVQLVFAIAHGTPVRVDTEAMLRTQGLTGIAYVELGGGERNSPLLVPTDKPPYPEIQTKPSLGARLENVLTSALAKLDRASTTIDLLLDETNRKAIASTLTDAAQLMKTLAGRSGSIDAGLRDAARTFDQSAKASVQIGPVLDRIGRSADAVQALGIEGTRASHDAGVAVKALGADAQRFGAEALPELQRLMSELQTLAVSLQRLSEQTQNAPNGLLFGRTPAPPGPGETATGARAP
jgi:phospholipid/cholesterol/gamma-HCH transport system substrate-binding protein